jgi:hypothetical protein
MFQRGQSMTAIALERAVIAIVQEDDIASTDVTQAVSDSIRIVRSPIPCFRRPHDDALAAAALDYAIELRAAKTKGRAHPTGSSSDRGFDGVVAEIELIRDISCRHKCKRWMSVRMIADNVAAVRNLLRKRWKRAHAAADDEESRAHFVPVEQIEQFRRDSQIRTVVKGKRHGRRISSAANGGAKELR